MGAGMAYSFLSIPLALAYLDKAEYGVWTLIMTISGYINFTELGISNSIQRHLIEVKEGRPNRSYGGVFSVLRCFRWVLLGVEQAGKRDNNESGTQEVMTLSSGIFKAQVFLGRLKDEPPFSSWLGRAGHLFNPSPGFTGLMPE